MSFIKFYLQVDVSLDLKLVTIEINWSIKGVLIHFFNLNY